MVVGMLRMEVWVGQGPAYIERAIISTRYIHVHEWWYPVPAPGQGVGACLGGFL